MLLVRVGGARAPVDPVLHPPLGATEGQDGAGARTTGLREADRLSNCQTLTQRNCYQPLEKIKSVQEKGSHKLTEILGWPA